MALSVVAAFGKTGTLFQDNVSLDLDLGAAGTYACFMLVSSLSTPTPVAGKVDGSALSSSQAEFTQGFTGRLYYGEFTTADGTITLRGEVSDTADSAKMLGIIVSGYGAGLIESYQTYADPVWDTTQRGPSALVSATGNLAVGLLLDTSNGTLTTVGGSGGTDWGPTPADTGNAISDGTNKFVLTWPGAATVNTDNGTWAGNMQPMAVFFSIPAGSTQSNAPRAAYYSMLQL